MNAFSFLRLGTWEEFPSFSGLLSVCTTMEIIIYVSRHHYNQLCKIDLKAVWGSEVRGDRGSEAPGTRVNSGHTCMGLNPAVQLCVSCELQLPNVQDEVTSQRCQVPVKAE